MKGMIHLKFLIHFQKLFMNMQNKEKQLVGHSWDIQLDGVKMS